MKRFIALVFASVFLLSFVGCGNTENKGNDISQTPTGTPNSITKQPIDSQDNIEETFPTSDESVAYKQDSPPVYSTDTQVFNNIRAMKIDLEKNLQPDTLSLYELQGLPDKYEESWVEWADKTDYLDYFIYYTDADKVTAFMPFESESALSAMKEDWLSDNGTYEYLLSNELIHDVVKTEISTDYGIAYECTYSTRIKTDLRIRYYEYQDSLTNRRYILSVDVSPDGMTDSFSLFVFDNANSFMCGGTDSNMSLDVAFGLYSVVVE